MALIYDLRLTLNLSELGVGKTALVERFLRNTFNPATASTIGASFVTKRVLDSTSDTVVRLQIWDTAGQERFRSISRLYYRSASACLLCYDVSHPHFSAKKFTRLTRNKKDHR